MQFAANDPALHSTSGNEVDHFAGPRRDAIEQVERADDLDVENDVAVLLGIVIENDDAVPPALLSIDGQSEANTFRVSSATEIKSCH